MMKVIRMLLFTIVLIGICGCVSNKYVLKEIEGVDPEDSGIVFGRVTLQRFFGLGMYNADASFGRGMAFKNRDIGKFVGVGGVHYFVLQLPPGGYDLVSMGVPVGYLAPRDTPFQFTVEKGKIKYIGAIVGDRDLKQYLDEIATVRQPRESDIKAYRVYGVGRYDKSLVGRPTGVAGEPYIEFFIIDEGQAAISKFLEDFPQYKEQEIIVDLIR